MHVSPNFGSRNRFQIYRLQTIIKVVQLVVADTFCGHTHVPRPLKTISLRFYWFQTVKTQGTRVTKKKFFWKKYHDKLMRKIVIATMTSLSFLSKLTMIIQPRNVFSRKIDFGLKSGHIDVTMRGRGVSVSRDFVSSPQPERNSFKSTKMMLQTATKYLKITRDDNGKPL